MDLIVRCDLCFDHNITLGTSCLVTLYMDMDVSFQSP